MAVGTHCTLYGSALDGADLSPGSPLYKLLGKYDTLIVSPGVYALLPVEFKTKAAAYFSFFSWPRYRAAANDWQPGPGDLKMPEVTKDEGGHNWIYTVSWDWAMAFCSAMLRFALRNPFQRIHLEEWQRSHSHWGIPDWAVYAQPEELPELMRRVEQVANWLSLAYGSGPATALSGHPEDFQPDQPTLWYAESFGSEWHPAIPIMAKARPGMFVQVNSDDADTRRAAWNLAKWNGGSVGMQPDEGVLSYDDIEDTADWPA